VPEGRSVLKGTPRKPVRGFDAVAPETSGIGLPGGSLSRSRCPERCIGKYPAPPAAPTEGLPEGRRAFAMQFGSISLSLAAAFAIVSGHREIPVWWCPQIWVKPRKVEGPPLSYPPLVSELQRRRNSFRVFSSANSSGVPGFLPENPPLSWLLESARALLSIRHDDDIARASSCQCYHPEGFSAGKGSRDWRITALRLPSSSRSSLAPLLPLRPLLHQRVIRSLRSDAPQT